MSDLSDCCYGMGFGPEGDGVELKAAPPGFNDDLGDYWSKPGKTDLFATVGGSGGGGPAWTIWTVRLADDLPVSADLLEDTKAGSFENIQWPQFTFETKESTAKPSLPALTRQAGEKYKGLGFCSE